MCERDAPVRESETTWFPLVGWHCESQAVVVSVGARISMIIICILDNLCSILLLDGLTIMAWWYSVRKSRP